jgi:hypothetical protein
VIDSGNDPASWPGAVVNSLAKYRQGSLVPSAAFFYVTNPELPIWMASRLNATDPEPVEVIALSPEDQPPYGIITSQSCDIDEEERNQKPWVQVAPVYEVSADHKCRRSRILSRADHES